MNPACTGKVVALTLMLTLTGIQYKATDENCDVILKSCDFHTAFETDSPGDWVVESRTCFGSTLTLHSPLTSHPHPSPRPPSQINAYAWIKLRSQLLASVY